MKAMLNDDFRKHYENTWLSFIRNGPDRVPHVKTPQQTFGGILL